MCVRACVRACVCNSCCGTCVGVGGCYFISTASCVPDPCMERGVEWQLLMTERCSTLKSYTAKQTEVLLVLFKRPAQTVGRSMEYES